MAGDRRLCVGCRDDHYNRAGNSPSGECFSLAGATVHEPVYLLHWWTGPATPGAFSLQERGNSCWHSPGNYQQYTAAQVPPFARDREGKHPVTGKEPRD